VPIDYLKCYMNITSKKPELPTSGRSLPGSMRSSPASPLPHLLRPRGSAQFEMMGVYPLNESVQSDAHATAQRSDANSGCATVLACPSQPSPMTPAASDDVLEIAGGAPVVIKLLEGTQGIGVC